MTELLKRHSALVAVLITGLLVHFWYIFLHPSTALYGGPGDHTAGIIWLFEQYPNSPWWGFSFQSAAPFGENYWDPSFIFSQAVYILFWLCAKVAGGGIAGYNLLTIIGFSFSLISFYWVATQISRLPKIFLALVAYVMSFSPFVLSLNSVGHFTYIFAPGFVAILCYVFFQSHQEPTIKKAAILGGIIGLSWLIDPYFLLFSALLFGGLLLGAGALFAYKRKLGSAIKLYGKYVAVVCIVIVCSTAPLLVYAQANKNALQATTSTRASIYNDAQQYSARVKDYLLPSAENPLIPKAVKDIKLASYHGKNPTFTLYIGVGISVGIVLGVALLYRSRRSGISIGSKYIGAAGVLVVASVVLFIFSLPPRIELAGIVVPGPSGLIVALASAWRVFARLYIFMLPLLGLVLILLYSELDKQKHNLKPMLYLILGALLAVSVFEYLPRNPFDATHYWSVEKSLPSTYFQIKNNNQIRRIAEYPLREAPHYKGSLYFSGQISHKKELVNSSKVWTSTSPLRQAVMDLDNPQTLRTLRFLGVDAIHVWNNSLQTWHPREDSGVVKIASADFKSMFGNDKPVLYTLKQTLKSGRYVLWLSWDSRVWDEGIFNLRQQLPREHSMKIVDLCELMPENTVCEQTPVKDFDVHMTLHNADSRAYSIRFMNDGKTNQVEIKPGNNELMFKAKLGDIKYITSAEDGNPLSINNFYVESASTTHE